jgi:hypothetical protein
MTFGAAHYHEQLTVYLQVLLEAILLKLEPLLEAYMAFDRRLEARHRNSLAEKFSGGMYQRRGF